MMPTFGEVRSWVDRRVRGQEVVPVEHLRADAVQHFGGSPEPLRALVNDVVWQRFGAYDELNDGGRRLAGQSKTHALCRLGGVEEIVRREELRRRIDREAERNVLPLEDTAAAVAEAERIIRGMQS